MQIQESLKLRVAEAAPRDAGRTVVRLDPADLQALGANVGDVIELRGPAGVAVAKALPAYLEDRGKHQAQMDGLLRHIARNGLKDLIRRKANFDWHRELITDLGRTLPWGNLAISTLFSL